MSLNPTSTIDSRHFAYFDTAHFDTAMQRSAHFDTAHFDTAQCSAVQRGTASLECLSRVNKNRSQHAEKEKKSQEGIAHLYS